LPHRFAQRLELNAMFIGDFIYLAISGDGFAVLKPVDFLALFVSDIPHVFWSCHNYLN
jgi:hypothetical protein